MTVRIINADVIEGIRGRDGRFVKGANCSPQTQFKKGQHWRPRKPHWDREWLLREYVDRGRSAADIAHEVGCKENNIYFWLAKHDIPRRSMKQIRASKYWGAPGDRNPMFGKREHLHPQWTGGQHERVNPHYNKWRRAVLERDRHRCSLCHSSERLEVHHIVRFNKAKDKRWEVSNGLTLCKPCHANFRNREEAHEEILSFIASLPKHYLNGDGADGWLFDVGGPA